MSFEFSDEFRAACEVIAQIWHNIGHHFIAIIQVDLQASNAISLLDRYLEQTFHSQS